MRRDHEKHELHEKDNTVCDRMGNVFRECEERARLSLSFRVFGVFRGYSQSAPTEIRYAREELF
jgi:hypothetical protein